MESGIPWAAGAMALIFIAIAAKGCNDSDNALYVAAAKAGCSVVSNSRGSREIVCPGFERKEGMR